MKLFTVALILLVSIAAVSQTADQPKVQVVPAKATPAYSGQAMFNAYCASCHGTDLKGHGPAAPAMKSPVPDLTTLAKSHGGTFPAFMIAETLRVSKPLASHGTAEMPIWGPVFSSVSRQNQAEMQLRIHNLTEYIASLQVK